MGGVTEPADLVFVRGKDFLDRSIETITRSAYSHVALVVSGSLLIEAQGFRLTGYQSTEAYKGQADLYRIYGLSNNEKQKIVAAAKKHFGQRYDYGLIAVEFVRELFGAIIPWYEGGKVICSTLIWDAFKDGIGLDLTPGIRFPAPGDIARSGNVRKVVSF